MAPSLFLCDQFSFCNQALSLDQTAKNEKRQQGKVSKGSEVYRQRLWLRYAGHRHHRRGCVRTKQAKGGNWHLRGLGWMQRPICRHKRVFFDGHDGPGPSGVIYRLRSTLCWQGAWCRSWPPYQTSLALVECHTT